MGKDRKQGGKQAEGAGRFRKDRTTGGKWTKSAGRLRWHRNIRDGRDCRGARGLLLEGETWTWNREDLRSVEHEPMLRGV